jgi:hypothetical protein
LLYKFFRKNIFYFLSPSSPSQSNTNSIQPIIIEK